MRRRSPLAALFLVAAAALPAARSRGQEPPEAPTPHRDRLSSWTVVIQGHRGLSRRHLVSFLGSHGEQPVTETDMEDVAYFLEEHYRSLGFPFARVGALINGPHRKVVFVVQEGHRVQVERVVLEGVASERRGRVEALVRTGRSSWGSRPWFVERPLREDADRIREDYYAQGYLETRVRHEVEYSRDLRRVRVRLRVEEGPRIHVEEVIFWGNVAFADGALSEALGLGRGTSFNPRAGLDGRHRVEEFYRDRGYPFVRVTHRAEVDRESGEALLTYTIDEGPLARIGAVRVEGHELTHGGFLRRQAGLVPGALFRQSELDDARRGLYQLGTFRSVEVRPVPSPTGEPGVVDVRVQVEEDPPGELRVGAGVGSFEQYRLQAGISYDNVLGRAKVVDFTTAVSLIGTRQVARYIDRRLAGTRFEMDVEGVREKREDVSFHAERLGGTVTLAREVFWREPGALRASVGLRREQSSVSSLETGLVDEERTLDLMSLIGALVHDSRRGPGGARGVGALAQPQSGVVGRVSAELAGEPVGGEADFTKLQGSLAAYQRVFPALGEDALVLAGRAMGGLIFLTGDDANAPVQERFFTGGESSVRGYRERRLGPRNEAGTFLGGRSVIVLGAELRFPVVGGLHGVLFRDWGNAGLDDQGLDTSDLVSTAGGGLNYMTPIGPVRAEWGQKLDREPGETHGELHLSVGFAF